MSRIGKLPVIIPESVQVTLAAGVVRVKGPKGELVQVLHPHITVQQADGRLTVQTRNPDKKEDRALWGLFQRLISNMVRGVTDGYERRLEINGVGYQATAQPTALVLNVGYSQPVNFPLPEGVTAAVEKNVIRLMSLDKQLVGETAAQLRRVRPPEPYKGKGIKYQDEIIRRKAGKQAKTAGPGAGK